MEIALARDLTGWDRYQAKAKELQLAVAKLRVSFTRQLESTFPPGKEGLALVSTTMPSGSPPNPR